MQHQEQSSSQWVAKGTEPFSFLVVTAVCYNMDMRLIFNPGRKPVESILQRLAERSKLEPGTVRSTQDRPCRRVGWALAKREILIPVRQTCTKLMEVSAWSVSGYNSGSYLMLMSSDTPNPPNQPCSSWEGTEFTAVNTISASNKPLNDILSCVLQHEEAGIPPIVAAQ